MVNLEEAYQSLDNAKREVLELREECDRLSDARNLVDRYTNEFNPYSTIETIKLSNDTDKRSGYFNIIIALIVYVLVFGIMDLIAVLGFGNYGMITTSIGAGIGSYGVCISKYVKKIREASKSTKKIGKLEELIGDDPELKNCPLSKLLTILEEKRSESITELYAKKKALPEYEQVLREKNEELAEELLRDSGIEASVSLDSAMKVLSKKYDHKK